LPELPPEFHLRVPLGSAVVDVWWCSTQVGDGTPVDPPVDTPEDEARARLVVDRDTVRRADTSARAEDRRRVLLTHALLRRVLAPLVGVPPADVPVRRGCARCGSAAHGRPYVAGHEQTIDVSLAHGGGLGVVAVVTGPAVAAGLRIGVDVEPHPVAAVLREGLLAAMSSSELGANLTRPDPERAHLRSWTGKEAVAKATGLGMGDPMIGLDVSPAGDGADWSALRSGGAGGVWVAFPPARTTDDADGARHVLAVAAIAGSRTDTAAPMG
jgi:4'-phosphopantetheinyl transferase